MIQQRQCAMTSTNLRGPEDALAYMTECTLATVSDLAHRARPPKGELRRQISIAQTGIDAVRPLVSPGETFGCGRVQEVLAGGGDVSAWVESKIGDDDTRPYRPETVEP